MKISPSVSQNDQQKTTWLRTGHHLAQDVYQRSELSYSIYNSELLHKDTMSAQKIKFHVFWAHKTKATYSKQNAHARSPIWSNHMCHKWVIPESGMLEDVDAPITVSPRRK